MELTKTAKEIEHALINLDFKYAADKRMWEGRIGHLTYMFTDGWIQKDPSRAWAQISLIQGRNKR